MWKEHYFLEEHAGYATSVLACARLTTCVRASLEGTLGISRACAHLFFRHVLNVGTHFSKTRPVEFRRAAAVSDIQHTRCICYLCQPPHRGIHKDSDTNLFNDSLP